MKLTKYNYHVLMIKDTYQTTELILWPIFIETVIIIKKICDNK